MTLMIRGTSTVESVFGIHGDDENDVTAGFAYLLAQSEVLLKLVVADVLPRFSADSGNAIVRLEAARKGEGRTDIEIDLSTAAFVVFEAKKGSELPTAAQLRQYTTRCKTSGCRRAVIVVLTAVDREVAEVSLGKDKIDGVELTARSWKWVRAILKTAWRQERGSHVRWLLSEYGKFLETFMGQARIFSNLVYVVSLGKGNPPRWPISWIGIVEKCNQYFYSIKNWPAPPNYMGFRYDGQLQSIRHVKSFEVVQDVRTRFPGSENGDDWGPHYLLKLGRPIIPSPKPRRGPRIIRNTKVWCMFDTLFTNKTISDALTETERRMEEEGE